MIFPKEKFCLSTLYRVSFLKDLESRTQAFPAARFLNLLPTSSMSSNTMIVLIAIHRSELILTSLLIRGKIVFKLVWATYSVTARSASKYSG